MSEQQTSSPRNMRNEGESALIRGASLILILLFALSSHVPLLELLGIMPLAESIVGITLTWILLFTNIYVVVGTYVVVRWLAVGTDGREEMEELFAGKHIRYLVTISLGWLSLFWVVQQAL